MYRNKINLGNGIQRTKNEYREPRMYCRKHECILEDKD